MQRYYRSETARQFFIQGLFCDSLKESLQHLPSDTAMSHEATELKQPPNTMYGSSQNNPQPGYQPPAIALI